MDQKKVPVSRRVFNKTLLGAGAATVMASSKLIKPARAQDDDFLNQTIAAGTRDRMSDFKNAMDYGKSPWDLDSYEIASATTAQIGIARAYGLDQAMESLYGQDGQITQAVDWAYQEGGWDPFWSLALFGIHGMASDWFDDHPEWGNFDKYRTGWPTGIWINGTGPISSPTPNVTGYTEIPMWPAA